MKRKNDFRKDAKVLIYDLECSPTKMYAYGFYEAKVAKVLEYPKLLSLAWKWLGEEKVYCETIADYNPIGEYDDFPLIKRLHSLLDMCKLAVAYNGDKFDNTMANTFFLEKELPPPSPYKTCDPLKIARRRFRFENNSLNNVSRRLIGKGKTEQTYGDCWDDLMQGNAKARKQADKLMKLYNKNDVLILEEVYKKLLPWEHTHPNMALLSGHDVCPKCGFNDGFRVKAYRYTGVQINAIQYQCKHCGGYVTRPLDKEERETLLEEGKLKSTFRNLNP